MLLGPIQIRSQNSGLMLVATSKTNTQMKTKSIPRCNLLDPFIFHELSSLKFDIAQHSYMVALAAFQRGLTVRFHGSLTHLERFAHLPVQGLHGEMFSVTDGKTTRYFHRSMSDLISKQLSALCNNKQATKMVLSRAGVSVPPGVLIHTGQEPAIKNFLEYYRGNTFLLKPLGGTLGKGVVRNIPAKQVMREIEKIAGEPHLLEVYLRGNEYRVYVVSNQVIAAFERVPSHLKGDGKKTIEELIESHNKVREHHFLYRESPIRYNEETKLFLNRSRLQPSTIPGENQIIWLNDTPSYMQGGVIEWRDPSERLKNISGKAAKAINIPVAGLDIIVCNKGRVNEQAYVLEINQCPYLTTAFGDLALGSRPVFNLVADAIIDHYFPDSVKNQRFINASFDLNSILHVFGKSAVDFIELPTFGQGIVHTRKMISVEHAQRIDFKKRLVKARHLGLKVKVMQHQFQGFLIDLIGTESEDQTLTGLMK